jgi:hypothetical protein
MGHMQVRLSKPVAKLVRNEAAKQSRLNRLGENKLGEYRKVSAAKVANQILFECLTRTGIMNLLKQ